MSNAAAQREHVRDEAARDGEEAVPPDRRRALVVRAERAADLAAELLEEMVEVRDPDAHVAVDRSRDTFADHEPLDELPRRRGHLHDADGARGFGTTSAVPTRSSFRGSSLFRRARACTVVPVRAAMLVSVSPGRTT